MSALTVGALTDWDLDRLLAQERALRRLDTHMAYTAGYAAGLAAGRAEAEAEMDREWAHLARTVKDNAARLKGGVPEPAPWPQHDDSIWFTPDQWAELTGQERSAHGQQPVEHRAPGGWPGRRRVA